MEVINGPHDGLIIARIGKRVAIDITDFRVRMMDHKFFDLAGKPAGDQLRTGDGPADYHRKCSQLEGVESLFGSVDPSFSKNVRKDDIIIAGDNFGCGSSREHPSVGLAYAGIKAIIVKSVNRIFYRSSINQGLLLIVHREAVESYTSGDKVDIDFVNGKIMIGSGTFSFEPMPEKLKQILDMKGLVNYMKTM